MPASISSRRRIFATLTASVVIHLTRVRETNCGLRIADCGFPKLEGLFQKGRPSDAPKGSWITESSGFKNPQSAIRNQQSEAFGCGDDGQQVCLGNDASDRRNPHGVWRGT